MSIEVYAMAQLVPVLKDRERAVFLALCGHVGRVAGREQRAGCHPSRELLAFEANNVSVKTVQRAVDELERMRVIRVERSAGRHTNHYEVNLVWLMQAHRAVQDVRQRHLGEGRDWLRALSGWAKAEKARLYADGVPRHLVPSHWPESDAAGPDEESEGGVGGAVDNPPATGTVCPGSTETDCPGSEPPTGSDTVPTGSDSTSTGTPMGVPQTFNVEEEGHEVADDPPGADAAAPPDRAAASALLAWVRSGEGAMPAPDDPGRAAGLARLATSDGFSAGRLRGERPADAAAAACLARAWRNADPPGREWIEARVEAACEGVSAPALPVPQPTEERPHAV